MGGNCCKRLGSRLIGVVFEYETVKIVAINSKKIGLLCRVIQLMVIGYIIGFVLVYKKGYQESDIGTSGLISKVKGVSLANRSIIGKPSVWDVADYVVPPQEKNAFFITTNALVTRLQTQGTCPEDPSVQDARCSVDSDCTKDKALLLGNGVETGKCNETTKTCEILAWCPVESDTDDKRTVKSGALLQGVEDFTVLIKNSVEFSRFKTKLSNIPRFYNKTKLASCRYDPVSDKLCPIFRLGLIFQQAGTSYQELGAMGGVVSININWNCDFDYNPFNCYPTYNFTRLDQKDTNISKGWNFRYANYYYKETTQYRDLIKAYGILFVISVKATAGKFNIMPLTMNVGSGLALLAIATVVCDFLVIYCLKMRDEYRKHKYLTIKGDDAYQPFESDSETDKINQ